MKVIFRWHLLQLGCGCCLGLQSLKNPSWGHGVWLQCIQCLGIAKYRLTGNRQLWHLCWEKHVDSERDILFKMTRRSHVFRIVTESKSTWVSLRICLGLIGKIRVLYFANNKKEAGSH